MIRGLLVDLDDTLLDNDLGRFLPAYFQLLGEFFSDHGGANEVLPHLLRATKRMMENRDPLRTLKDVFDASFYPALGIELATIQPQVEAFYREVFPQLRSLTAPRPAAAALVGAARELGHGLVVATNPLMPEAAVRHRLEWAGMPPTAAAFDLITTYEDFHFAKPDPAYYAEILGRMGWRPNEAAMIGNEPADDLEPAALLGMPVFHIGSGLDGRFPAGDLPAAVEWVRRGDPAPDPRSERPSTSVPARFRGQLAALDHYVRRLDAGGWTRRPADGEWSPVESVCHLRDVEAEVTLPRVEVITAGNNPFLDSPDTDRWVQDRDYQSQSGPEAFSVLAKSRALLLDRLTELPPEAWSLPARHALLGPTTLEEVLSTSAEHELVHLARLKSSGQWPVASGQ